MPVLAVMHTVQVTLPSSALIAAMFLFLSGFVLIRIAIRIWDLVGV